ncbi:Variant-specific surface protein [Giardia duodenalis]|uniref:Variant-specific surface protein n=1 Tax=Giardia intestinalis TaxID=5741 RepID=V6TLN7_GIAIN|nr:Variant-specific surface protein [Giardia intestinalis]
MTVSAAMTCQAPALGCLLICISRSDMHHPLWSSMHSLRDSLHIACALWLPRGPSIPHCHFHTAWCCSVNSVHALCSPTCIQCCDSVPRAGACYWTLLSGSACTSCESNSGGITGVRGCASCAAPSGSTGPVLCYLVRDSASVNKGGLSSGAIAGISVAAVVVVGGLVGFLCWWFICRGKA